MRYGNLSISFLLLFLITTNTLGQTELKSSLQSNIGGSTDPGNIMLTVSAGGQPSPIGVASNSTISLFSGYVYTLLDSINPPPAFTHNPVTSAPANQNIQITATIQDDSGIDNATLNYREGGGHRFHSNHHDSKR